MAYQRIVISSGHGRHVRGASGILDEVVEARKVVEQLADELRKRGVEVRTFHDNTSTSQDQNLNTIVNYHNAQNRDLDISIHFNAYAETPSPMGTECLYVTQENLAQMISGAIATSGLIDRGPKYRNDLFSLNNTEEPAVLVETCFVDSVADAEIYEAEFGLICKAIAAALTGQHKEVVPPLLPQLDTDVLEEIFSIGSASPVPNIEWADRGRAPTGYAEGMALRFSTVVRKYLLGYGSAREMAKANTWNDDVDVLAHYAPQFAARSMWNNRDGLPTLRHLWTFLYGLGMRESSGRYCEGRDMSADNV